MSQFRRSAAACNAAPKVQSDIDTQRCCNKLRTERKSQWLVKRRTHRERERERLGKANETKTYSIDPSLSKSAAVTIKVSSPST